MAESEFGIHAKYPATDKWLIFRKIVTRGCVFDIAPGGGKAEEELLSGAASSKQATVATVVAPASEQFNGVELRTKKYDAAADVLNERVAVVPDPVLCLVCAVGRGQQLVAIV